MKILIIGPLGAGKSSLAYAINKRYNLARLNMDEVCRCPADGSFYTQEEQFSKLNKFLAQHDNWVAEGSTRHLYEKMCPDLIVDMRVNRWVAMWRFTWRFIKAKKLVGKEIDKDLPVQAYHYRKITLSKIRDYDLCGQEISAQIADFMKTNTVPVVTCRSFKQHTKVFRHIDEMIKGN